MAIAAAGIAIIAAEGSIGLGLVVVGLAGSGVMLDGGYFFIARRGVLWWLGLAVVIIVVFEFVTVFLRANVVAVALLSLGLRALGGATARAALRHNTTPWMPTSPAPPARRPFIVMNPRSGGGKVVCFDWPTRRRR